VNLSLFFYPDFGCDARFIINNGHFSGRKARGKTLFSRNVVTATYPTGADSPSALPATGVPRISPIDGFTARLAFITVKGKSAIATDQHMVIPALGNDMDRAADQADRCHFRLVSDAVAVLAIMIEQFAGRILVKGLHVISSR
jgi:hypothetical protein